MDYLPSPLKLLSHRQTLSWLLVLVFLLPVGMTILFTFGRLFLLLHDPLSTAVLDYAALGLGFFWLLSLVLLLICTALAVLFERAGTEENDSSFPPIEDETI